jgi:hypothetical protein
MEADDAKLTTSDRSEAAGFGGASRSGTDISVHLVKRRSAQTPHQNAGYDERTRSPCRGQEVKTEPRVVSANPADDVGERGAIDEDADSMSSRPMLPFRLIRPRLLFVHNRPARRSLSHNLDAAGRRVRGQRAG